MREGRGFRQVVGCRGCDYLGTRSSVRIDGDTGIILPDEPFFQFFPFCAGKDPLLFSFWLDGLDCLPEDRRSIEEACALVCTAAVDGGAFSGAPLIMHLDDGESGPHLYSMTFHGGGGRPPSFCITRYPLENMTVRMEEHHTDWSCLDAMNEAVIILRPDARVYRANRVAHEMLSSAGMKEGAPVSAFWKRLLWEDGVCPMIDFITVSRDTMPRDVIAEDIRGRFWRIRTGLLGASEKTFSGFIQTAVEMTEWMGHRTELDEVRHRFAAFMEHLPSAALILGLDGTVEYCNPYMKHSLFQGGYGTEHGPCILPPGMIRSLQGLFPQVLHEGRLNIEHKHRIPGADDQVFSLTLFPIPCTGDAPLIGAIAVDMTRERKNDRERAALADTLLEAQKVAQLGMWDYLDGTGSITFHGISPHTLSPEPDDVSLPLDTFLSLVSPDAREEVSATVCDRSPDARHELTFSLGGSGDAVRYAGFRARTRTDGIPGSVGTIQDLTEKITTEKAYARVENRFRSYFNSKITASMIVEPVCDETGEWTTFRYLAVNQAFSRMMEVDGPSLIGKTVHECGGDDAQAWVSLFREAVRRGGSYTGELSSEQSGRVFSCYIFRLKEGNAAENDSYGCSFLDISKEEEALRVLQENDEFFRIIFPSTIEGIFVIDTETHTILDANETACRMVGLDRDEIIGHNCRDLICPVREGPCPVTDLGEEMYMKETVIPGPDGKPVPVLKSVKRVVYLGKTCLIEMVVDLKKVKAAEAARSIAEERYRMVFETSPDGVMITDLENISEVNTAFASALGYTPEEMNGCPVIDFSPPFQEDGVSSAWKRDQFLADLWKNGHVSARWDALHRDGQTVHFEMRGGLMNVSGRKMVVIVGRDITRVLEMEKEQRVALDQIEENLAKLATLNDHIRNPLMVISAYTEMDESEHAMVIMNQIGEIDEIINSLDRGFLESEKIREFLRKHHDFTTVS